MTPIEGILLALLAVAPSAIAVVWMPRSSNRWFLGVTLALTIPVVGPLLALLVIRTQGTNQIEQDLDAQRTPPRHQTYPAAIARAGGMPPLLDRLMSPDRELRLSALEALSWRSDRDAVDLLRWTIKHGLPDAVLDAALTLEELELHWQRRFDEAVEASESSPSFETCIAAADLAIEGLESGIADPAISAGLVAVARASCDRAAGLDPSRADDVGLRRARLELAAGDPTTALEICNAIIRAGASVSHDLRDLRARARFAVRQRPSREIGFTVFGEAAGAGATSV